MARLRPYQRPWINGGEHEAMVRAAAKLVTFVLAEPDMTETLRRHVLRDALWAVTEDGGKYTTRYRSRGVVNLEADQWQSLLRHDHVVTRKALASRLRSGEDALAVLSDALACTVTKEEHDRLSQYDEALSGWARYEAAGVEVLDMLTGEPLRCDA